MTSSVKTSHLRRSAKSRSAAGWRWLAAGCLIALCLLPGVGAIGQESGGQGGTSAGGSSGSTQGASSMGAAPAAAPAAGQALLYPGEDFTLSPGDLIAVRVFMQPDYEATVRVSAEGAVHLPFIGSVAVTGLKVRQAQTLIADRLRSGEYYRDPEVIIQVLDTVNSTVTLSGEVRAVVPVSNQRSLREVLLTAGGLPANASHTVKIVRQGIAQPIEVRLGPDLAASAAANIPVKPHDFIYITRANVVYVLGAFQKQGAVPLDQAAPLTLLQLTALSGGANFEGRYDDLRIIRTVSSPDGPKRMVVQVDYKKIRQGKANDPVLQADDIVLLPTVAMKAAMKNLGVGGILGLVSLVIAAHGF